METINCIIVDDSRLDRLIVEDFVQQYADFKLKGCFSNPLECIETLKTQKIDVLFIDIDMPVMNGVDFFKTLKDPPVCVFITGYADYALEAFEIHAFEFLLKPVKKERFEEAVRRLRDLFQIQEKALQYELHFEKDKITIKEGSSINKVQSNDIIYLEALTNYTKVVTPNKKYTTLCNLKNFIDKLPPEKFLRIHRSYAVAVDKIQRVENGMLQLGTFSLPIGKTYRQQINKVLLKV
ncbi:MAG: LytTR family DNA-binding domain-containing protein [Chitinophagaceae bacterium]